MTFYLHPYPYRQMARRAVQTRQRSLDKRMHPRLESDDRLFTQVVLSADDPDLAAEARFEAAWRRWLHDGIIPDTAFSAFTSGEILQVLFVAILFVLKGAATDIYRRLMDAVDPDLVDTAYRTLEATDGVREVESVRLRWIGHRVYADAGIVVAADLTVVAAHDIAIDAHHRLLHAVPKLAQATVHVSPFADDGEDHHRTGAPVVQAADKPPGRHLRGDVVHAVVGMVRAGRVVHGEEDARYHLDHEDEEGGAVTPQLLFAGSAPEVAPRPPTLGMLPAVFSRRIDNTDPSVTMTAPAANVTGTITLALSQEPPQLDSTAIGIW